MHERVSNCHTHKKSFFTKRNMPPKNAPSLRPTAAAALLSAALFCVVELAFARETQYFYNSVTGEVLYCALFDLQLLSSFFESNFFAYLAMCRFL